MYHIGFAYASSVIDDKAMLLQAVPACSKPLREPVAPAPGLSIPILSSFANTCDFGAASPGGPGGEGLMRDIPLLNATRYSISDADDEQARERPPPSMTSDSIPFAAQSIEPRSGNRHGGSRRLRSECVAGRLIADVGGRTAT